MWLQVAIPTLLQQSIRYNARSCQTKGFNIGTKDSDFGQNHRNFINTLWLQEIHSASIWNLILKRDQVETRFDFSMQELACALESIFCGKRHQKRRSLTPAVSSFLSVYAALQHLEKKAIKHQIPLFLFTIDGGSFILDTCFKVPFHLPRLDIRTGCDRRAVKPMKFAAPADKTFQWLLSECDLARADCHKFLFGLNDEGLLHCSKHFSSYLMTSKISKGSDLHTQSIFGHHCQGQNKESDGSLIVAKIAHGLEGVEILRREASNLKKLQFTGRVVELWDPESADQVLEQGALLTVYYPVPLDREVEFCLKKKDIEMVAVELLSTLDILHQNGWIWNGLRTGHYLYNLLRHDDRDTPTRLRALGLENAIHVGHDTPTASKAAHNVRDGCSVLDFPAEITIPGSVGKEGDIQALGRLLLSLCARTESSQGETFPNGLSHIDKTATITAHNQLVFDESKWLTCDDWIMSLIEMLLAADPAQRPSVSEALQYAIAQTRIHDEEAKVLVLGDLTQKNMPGYLDKHTGRFVWPIVLHTKVVHDIYDPNYNSVSTSPRLTKAITLKASLQMEGGEIAAKYGGRPIHKRDAQWLQLINLQSHAVSDGADGAIDGRREGNGIFDLCYYLSTRQVKEVT